MTPSDRTVLTDARLDEVLAALAGDATIDDTALAAARTRVLGAVGAPERVATGADVVELPVPTPVRPHRRRRFATALVAAAVLALVTVLGFTLLPRPSADDGPAGAGFGVTCLVDPDGPSGDADTRAATLIRARLAQLSSAPATVTVGSGEIAFSSPGLDRQTLLDVCTSPRPSLRPLVTAPIPVTAGPGDPLAADTTLPTSDTAFDTLPAARQAEIREAVAGADCSGGLDTEPTDRSVIVCDSTTAPTVAYLLGPAIVDSAQISTATAVAPAPQVADWAVEVTLAPAGDAAFGDYTRTHSTDRPGTAACSATTTPCSHHVGIVVADAVVSAPVITGEITGSIQISGALTETGATAIAAGLAAADLTLVAS